MNKCKYCTVDVETTEMFQEGINSYWHEGKEISTKDVNFGCTIDDDFMHCIDLTNNRLILDDGASSPDGFCIVACPFCGRKLGADTNGS